MLYHYHNSYQKPNASMQQNRDLRTRTRTMHIWSLDNWTKIQEQLNGENIIFSTNYAGTIENTYEKQNQKPQSIFHTIYRN